MRVGFGLSLLAVAAATGACASARERDVEVSKTFFEKGRAAYKAGKYEEAVRLFDQACAYNPSHASAHYWRGKARLKQIDAGDGSNYIQRTYRAIDDFTRAVKIVPFFGAYFHRAIAFATLARYRDAARDLLNHCLALRPQDRMANLLLARVYDEGFVGKEEEAIRYYQAYLDLSGAQADPWVRRRVKELKEATASRGQADREEAEATKLFEEAMRLVGQGKKAEAVNLLGRLMTRYGHTRVARQNERVLPLILRSIHAESDGSPGDERK